MERKELPRWLVPAVALAVVLSYVVTEVQRLVAHADCLDAPGATAASCGEAPSVWVLVLIVAVAILIGIMLVGQLRRPRK
jgi:hypothetical protein